MRSKRQYIHHHNSFQGHVWMGKMQMLAISKSYTANTRSKELAFEIIKLLTELGEELKQRDDSWINEWFK